MSLFDAPRSALPRWDAASLDGFSTHSASADPWRAADARSQHQPQQPSQQRAHGRNHAGGSSVASASASVSGSSSRASSPQRRALSIASTGDDDAAALAHIDVPAPLLDAWRAVSPGGAPSPAVAPEQAARVLASSGIDASRVQQILALVPPGPLSQPVFCLALVLLAHMQDGAPPNLPLARQQLRSGNPPLPTLDLARLPPASSRFRSSPAAHSSWDAPAAGSRSSAASPEPLPPSVSGFASLRAGSGWATSAAGTGRGEAASRSGRRNSLPSSAAPRSRPAGPEPSVQVRLSRAQGGTYFRHTLYTIASFLPGAPLPNPSTYGGRGVAHTVQRRYSDFTWLAEALVKRYPFRLLPGLPPKRMGLPLPALNLSTDEGFVEQRRRGLQRYLRSIVSHPVLRADSLVLVFLTETQPLAEWRVSAPAPELEEEGNSRVLTPAELQSVPADLESKMQASRAATPGMLERQVALVHSFERALRRREAEGAEHARMAETLESLQACRRGVWKPESERDDETEGRLAQAEKDFSDLAGARAQAMASDMLEALRYQRDLWYAARDLWARHERLSPDAVDSTRKKLEANAKRLVVLRQERAPGWEEEAKRLRVALEEDNALVERALRRREHTRLALWEELQRLHWQSRLVEAEWRAHTTREAAHLAATRRAADELAAALDTMAQM